MTTYIKWDDVEAAFDEHWRGELCTSDLFDALKQRRVTIPSGPVKPLSEGVTLETATVRTITGRDQ